MTDGPCGLLSAVCPQDSSPFLLRVQTHHTGKGITPVFHRYFLSACRVPRPCSRCQGSSKDKTEAPAVQQPTLHQREGCEGTDGKRHEIPGGDKCH